MLPPCCSAHTLYMPVHYMCITHACNMLVVGRCGRISRCICASTMCKCAGLRASSNSPVLATWRSPRPSSAGCVRSCTSKVMPMVHVIAPRLAASCAALWSQCVVRSRRWVHTSWIPGFRMWVCSFVLTHACCQSARAALPEILMSSNDRHLGLPHVSSGSCCGYQNRVADHATSDRVPWDVSHGKATFPCSLHSKPLVTFACSLHSQSLLFCRVHLSDDDVCCRVIKQNNPFHRSTCL